jgi:phage terminase large subunit GpA-like protein
MNAQYELADGSGRRMAVKMTFCDSGGEAGVTTNAYNFVRHVRSIGLSSRFHLVKGDRFPGAPRVRISHPDADKKSKAGARGEIPVLMFNPTINKDDLDNRLEIIAPGQGMVHFPAWLSEKGADKFSGDEMRWFYSEMTSEIRTPKGWERVLKRNEAWDLFYYAIGACASPYLNIERIDWNNPPPWADTWDRNPLIIEPNESKAPFEDQSTFDWSALGKNLG